MGPANVFSSPIKDEERKQMTPTKKAINSKRKLFAKLMLILVEFEDKCKNRKQEGPR